MLFHFSYKPEKPSYFLFSRLYLELKQKKSQKPARYSFLLCSTNSFCLFLHLPRGKCNISCDTSTSLSAGRRPASIQLHQSTSILQRDTHRSFCAQRSWLSLRCGPLRSQDSRADANTNIIPYKHFPNAQLSARFIFSIRKKHNSKCLHQTASVVSAPNQRWCSLMRHHCTAFLLGSFFLCWLWTAKLVHPNTIHDWLPGSFTQLCQRWLVYFVYHLAPQAEQKWVHIEMLSSESWQKQCIT